MAKHNEMTVYLSQLIRNLMHTQPTYRTSIDNVPIHIPLTIFSRFDDLILENHYFDELKSQLIEKFGISNKLCDDFLLDFCEKNLIIGDFLRLCTCNNRKNVV